MRMNIYVRDDLKGRMDAVEGKVNWSGVACTAFEEYLARLAAIRKGADMNAVVERVKATKVEDADRLREAGYEAGAEWARGAATAMELRSLYDFCQRAGAGFRFMPTYNPAQQFYSCAHPEDFAEGLELEGLVEAFWDNILDDALYQQRDKAAFVTGFLWGAAAVWQQIKDAV